MSKAIQKHKMGAPTKYKDIRFGVNTSKKRIYGYCKKYPRQIFWILSNNNWYFAKAFFGESILHPPACTFCYPKDKIPEGIQAWQYHLQQLVLCEDPIRYLKMFLNDTL